MNKSCECAAFPFCIFLLTLLRYSPLTYEDLLNILQNGADTLAEKGYDYREILTYFFEGINIENVNTLE